MLARFFHQRWHKPRFQFINTANKNDRRINKICITPEAEKLQVQTMEVANQTLNEALQGVTNGQVEIAKEVLQMVYENLS